MSARRIKPETIGHPAIQLAPELPGKDTKDQSSQSTLKYKKFVQYLATSACTVREIAEAGSNLCSCQPQRRHLE